MSVKLHLTMLTDYFQIFSKVLTTSHRKFFKEESLQDRMRRQVKKYDYHIHPYKPFVLTVKCEKLLFFVNHVTTLQEKLVFLTKIKEILLNVSKQLYDCYSPHMIYTFNNEIHLVFFYNDHGRYMYNGSLNKHATKISSHASLLFMQEMIKHHLTLSCICTSYGVEFDKDYEILNYVIWRQHDCKRNNISLIYKCYKNNEEEDVLNNKSSSDLYLELKGIEVPDFVFCGVILKKQLVYKLVKDTKAHLLEGFVSDNGDLLAKRKEFAEESFQLDKNFKENLQKYIVNKFL